MTGYSRRPYRRDITIRTTSTAKLALIKSRAQNARKKLGPAGFHADEFALASIRNILDSIIDLCEEDTHE